MSTPHKATPEQWGRIENSHPYTAIFAAILELRDRIAALEAAANSSAALKSSNHPAKPDSSPELVGGLVAKVTDAVVYGMEISDQRGAIDAILAAAEWFDAIGYGATASILRQELQRNG